MTHCKICGKKLELTPEYDMCMECQGKQHRTFTIPNNGGSVSNKTEMSKEMTAKEALEVLVNNLDQAKLKELSSSDDYWTKYEEVSEAIIVLENIILYEEVMEE